MCIRDSSLSSSPKEQLTKSIEENEQKSLISELPHTKIRFPNKQKVQALIDTGASSNFIDPHWAKKVDVHTSKLKYPIRCKVGDGTTTEISETCQLKFNIGNQQFSEWACPYHSGT